MPDAEPKPVAPEDVHRFRPNGLFQEHQGYLWLCGSNNKEGQNLWLQIPLDDANSARLGWFDARVASLIAPDVLPEVTKKLANDLMVHLRKFKHKGKSPIDDEIKAKTEELRTKRQEPTHLIPVPELDVDPLDSDAIVAYVEKFKNPTAVDFRREVIADFDLQQDREISEHTSGRQKEFKRQKGFYPELADFRIWSKRLKVWHQHLASAERALARRTLAP